jgi:hypothetical protein
VIHGAGYGSGSEKPLMFRELVLALEQWRDRLPAWLLQR